MNTASETDYISETSITTTQESCNILVDLLQAYGVKHAVISPGSRNAPIIISLNKCKAISKYIIVDERSAAFAAIGIIQQSREPVAIVCTSGSAVLDYAPAVAEAFYQQLPLIVISADRPHEWINQNDSQTILQHGILNNIVKVSYNIPYENKSKNHLWYANRIINEALQKAIEQPEGPVHINMQFNEPLYECRPLQSESTRIIKRMSPSLQADVTFFKHLAEKLHSKERILIIASMQKHSSELIKSLENIAGNNIVVLSEIIANTGHSKNIFHNTDRLLTEIKASEWNDYTPDLLITFGGSPVSRLIKKFLRENQPKEHWRIGIDHNIIDTMQNLSHRIEITPDAFFSGISEHIHKINGAYYEKWKNLAQKAESGLEKYINRVPWCDFKAMDIIMKSLPTMGINLQISNGSAIRYADIIGTVHDFDGSCHCNRGVSGIDGSTSTALGASLIYNGITLLITGDMSFSYDLSGLASQYNSQRLKIIILCNGGGGIFRFINGPSDLPEFEKYFEVHRDLPINKYADAFGFEYLQADDEVSLQDSLLKLLTNKHSSILAVHTNNEISATVLRTFFNRNK